MLVRAGLAELPATPATDAQCVLQFRRCVNVLCVWHHQCIIETPRAECVRWGWLCSLLLCHIPVAVEQSEQVCARLEVLGFESGLTTAVNRLCSIPNQ